MKHSTPTSFFLFLLAVLVAVPIFAQTPSAAITPAHKRNETDWMNAYSWQENEMNKGNIDLVMIGDSLIHGWSNIGQPVWNEYYRHRKALNLGIGAVRTEHVLYQLDNLPWDKIQPKVAVIQIGTNNVTQGDGTPPDETAQGILAIVERFEKRYPDIKIIVMHVLPRGQQPDSRERQLVAEINARLPDLLEGKKNVTLLDIGSIYVAEDGTIPKQLMDDFLHPTTYGYELWAVAMEPTLVKLLGESNPAMKAAAKPQENWWKERHTNNVKRMEQGNVDFVMVGDSITSRWDEHRDLLEKAVGTKNIINLGFEGDRTEHVLWRLDHLPLGKIQPKAAMIMIGTNNMGDAENTPWMIAKAIQAIVQKLQKAYPNMRIIVWTVFPRGAHGNGDWARHRVEEINIALPGLLKGMKNVELVDLWPQVLTKDGLLTKEMSEDALHLTKKGYQIWATERGKILRSKPTQQRPSQTRGANR